MGKKEEFLSLEWFKAKAEKSIDKSIEKYVNKIMDKDLVVKPYLSVKLVNDSLIVTMHGGTIFTKPNATVGDFELVANSTTKEEILDIIQDKVVARETINDKKKADKMVYLAEGFQLLSGLNDFIVKDNHIFLKGTNRTIPSLLIDKFAEVVGKYKEVDKLEELLENDDEYQGLKNFFMWCCLNPRAEVADSLYNFLHQNGMKITKQGFFVALRNVVKVDNTDNYDLVEFITNSYNKIKAVWKKNPADFKVVTIPDSGELEVKKSDFNVTDTKYVCLGDLTFLYKELPLMKENRYTDNWTRTFDIRIGQVVSMPKEEANWSTQDCATAGLHFAGHTAPYVLCGDTTVFTLHNPMKVVGIGTEKGRCWEYLPFMTTNVAEANAIMNSEDFDFMQLDEEYAIRELEDLTERVKEGFTAESNKHEFNLPSISTDEIRSIVASLEKMRESITKRVNLID